VTSSGVPEAVRRFASRHLEGVEMMEVLLLLHRQPDRWWTAETVAGELGTSLSSSERCLEVLASRRFLDARIAHAVLFRFSPVDPELEDGVRQLAAAYAGQRFAVISLVSSDRLASLRSFADAFRIRKRKEKADGDG
jgi:hypothetical protein